MHSYFPHTSELHRSNIVSFGIDFVDPYLGWLILCASRGSPVHTKDTDVVAGTAVWHLQGWLGHVDGQPHPVPVTPLLAAAVDLVLSFQQCLGEQVGLKSSTAVFDC